MDFLKLFLKLLGLAKDHYLDEGTPSARSERPSRPEPRFTAPVVEVEKTPAQWEDYFREILKSEFPSYTFREKVKVTDLVGFVSEVCQLYTTRPEQAYKAEWGQPYTFVLESNGAPRAVVMLGSGHSHDENVKYLIARMYAQKLGLPYINFYTQMPNERAYVIERIRKFLN